MLLRVYHLTEYFYPEEARDSFNELWLYPVDDHRQGLLEFRLDIAPDSVPRSRQDYFHNRVYDFHVTRPHTQLRVETQATVVTFTVPKPSAVAVQVLSNLEARFFEFLAPTPRVPLHYNWLELLGLRRPDPREDLNHYLLEVTEHLYRILNYDTRATQVDTRLIEFVEGRAGVCQDYAQAMLAVLRSVGIPARYVSGYLATGVGSEGSHAWIEAFVPGSGWCGYDPTNNSIITEQYVKKAHGRDYDDCPPLKGLRRGGGKESLNVLVKVESLQTPLAKG
ncbi:transglutaminase family protein [uncultured Meiothermus sp.]|uniref:transglutaminase family protein n=1 Tax=uncultured Meiothermus sp. TaxID=157471 RepID=UPI0026093164|nr:transglutaminase family protein [uncultured Meiothermus sp.]